MSQGDRFQRLFQLVVLLESGRALDTKELAEMCGVSRRTIFRDLKTLQESGLRVDYSEGRGGFALGSPRLLRPVEFSLSESLALLVACESMGDQRHGIPFLQHAKPAAMKLLGNLPGRLQDQLVDVPKKVEARIEKPAALEHAANHFETLHEAMRRGRQVRMKYRALTEPGRPETTFLLHPYRLLFVRHAWYVIGRSSLHRGIRTFHLGRIRSLDMLDSRYRIPPRFTLERHLGDAWLMIREHRKSYRIRIRFQSLVAENVSEVQWHRTQRITKRSDGTYDFEVTVASLKEIVWWILGYGDQAEVLSPPELREQLRRHAEGMLRMYSQK